jgi:hypothetical protein
MSTCEQVWFILKLRKVPGMRDAPWAGFFTWLQCPCACGQRPWANADKGVSVSLGAIPASPGLPALTASCECFLGSCFPHALCDLCCLLITSLECHEILPGPSGDALRLSLVGLQLSELRTQFHYGPSAR